MAQTKTKRVLNYWDALKNKRTKSTIDIKGFIRSKTTEFEEEKARQSLKGNSRMPDNESIRDEFISKKSLRFSEEAHEEEASAYPGS